MFLKEQWTLLLLLLLLLLFGGRDSHKRAQELVLIFKIYLDLKSLFYIFI